MVEMAGISVNPDPELEPGTFMLVLQSEKWVMVYVLTVWRKYSSKAHQAYFATPVSSVHCIRGSVLEHKQILDCVELYLYVLHVVQYCSGVCYRNF
jgi:hypothetical protein